MTKKHLLIAAISGLFFLALDVWSAQQEIAFHEETLRQRHANSIGHPAGTD